jgi:hypothetical protein
VVDEESSKEPLEVYPSERTEVAVESKLSEFERAEFDEFTGL